MDEFTGRRGRMRNRRISGEKGGQTVKSGSRKVKI